MNKLLASLQLHKKNKRKLIFKIHEHLFLNPLKTLLKHYIFVAFNPKLSEKPIKSTTTGVSHTRLLINFKLFIVSMERNGLWCKCNLFLGCCNFFFFSSGFLLIIPTKNINTPTWPPGLLSGDPVRTA